MAIPDAGDPVTAFDSAVAVAREYLAGLVDAPTLAAMSDDALIELPERPTEVDGAIRSLAAELSPAVMPSAGPRYFGFVTGGSLPASLAAEVLAAAWDQNCALSVMSPALSHVESVTTEWVADLLGLPSGLSAGYVTGATMANWTGLAAARHTLLARSGWDLEQRGMAGSPPLRAVVGAQRHSAIDLALRYLGVGRDQLLVVPADDQGRLDPTGLVDTLAAIDGPTIVCAQVGNVNTGSIDPMAPICEAAHAAGAWVHVDAAVGAWLAASPRQRSRLAGWEGADSWALDAHKGLNTAYDSGLVLTAHPDAHRASTQATAAYLPASHDARDGAAWTPEGSRRARALGIHAVLRQLGRSGVAAMVDRQCDLAAAFATALDEVEGASVLNDVTANQVLVRFGDRDATTRAVIAGVQAGGVCWMGATEWGGRACMRISVSNWMTTAADVDRSVAEIRRCLRALL